MSELMIVTRWHVAPSPFHGRGVFASSPIPQGAPIGLAHWFDGRRWHATRLGRLHNHSLTPTAQSVRMGDQRFLFASRDLLPGEEITVDYRLQPEFEQPQLGWR